MTRVSGITCLAVIGVTTVMLWLHPADADEQTQPGATVESVVAIARRLNPTVAAASLDFDAAVHKIGTAGVLADPTLILEAWDVNRQGVGQRRFGVEQEVKLWGKYGLERSIAQSDAEAAKFQGRATVIDLVAQVVAAHGEYNAAYEAVGISLEIKRRYDEILGLLRSRYGTTSVDQQDVIKAEIEAATAEGDVVRRQGEQKSAAARLNALIGRPSLAPLAAPTGFRPVRAISLAQVQALARSAKPDAGAGRSAKQFRGPNQIPYRSQLLPRRDARREIRAAARHRGHRRVHAGRQAAAALRGQRCRATSGRRATWRCAGPQRGAAAANRRTDRRRLVRRRRAAQGRADLRIAPAAAGSLIRRQCAKRFSGRLFRSFIGF